MNTFLTRTTRIAAAVAGAAVIIGGPALAGAAELTFDPAPVDGVYTDGTTVNITYTDDAIQAGDDYRVSICTVDGIGAYNAPACAKVDTTVSEGLVSGSVSVEATFVNAHRNLPGHEPSFSCTADNPCHVLVADHSTARPTSVAQSDAFIVE